MEVKTKYIKSDNITSVMESASIEVYDSLPLATYDVIADPITGVLKLKEVGDLDNLPNKVYGDLPEKVERVIETFKYRSPSNTGVMLSGLKGTGKTLMTRMISCKAREIGMSTILVNTSYQMHKLVQFIEKINIPAVIVFDEFDKTYDASGMKKLHRDDDDKESCNTQSSLLSLLDGVYSSNKLFVFSLNNVIAVNDYLLSRPGRVFYHYKFDALDPKTVEEVCMDRLDNKEFTGDIVMLSHVVKKFTYDILNAMVDECNHYGESPLKFADHLNIDVGIEGNYKFEAIDVTTGMSLGSKVQYISYITCRDTLNIPFDTKLYSDTWFRENDDPNGYKGGESAWKKAFVKRFKAKKLYSLIPGLELTNVNCAAWRDGPMSVWADDDSAIEGVAIRGSAENSNIAIHIPLDKLTSVWKITASVDSDGTITTVPLFGGRVVIRIQKQKAEQYTAAKFADGMDIVAGHMWAARGRGLHKGSAMPAYPADGEMM